MMSYWQNDCHPTCPSVRPAVPLCIADLTAAGFLVKTVRGVDRQSARG